MIVSLWLNLLLGSSLTARILSTPNGRDERALCKNTFMTDAPPHSDARIAWAHALTAGFAIPLIIEIPTSLALGSFDVAKYWAISDGLEFLINLLAVWIGVQYSASHILKNDATCDHRRVVILSTGYFASVMGLLYAASLLLKGSFTFYLMGAFGIMATMAIFYYASKRAFGVV